MALQQCIILREDDGITVVYNTKRRLDGITVVYNTKRRLDDITVA